MPIQMAREEFLAGVAIASLASLVAQHVELNSVQRIVAGEFTHEPDEEVVGVFARGAEPHHLLPLVVLLQDTTLLEGLL